MSSSDSVPSKDEDGDEPLVGVFIHPRTEPDLPAGFDWREQKKNFCRRNLLIHDAEVEGPLPRGTSEWVWGTKALHTKQSILARYRKSGGLVFNHRGLYERASGVVENSMSALNNGSDKGYHLDELDAFVWNKVDEAFVAHDVVAGRVTFKEGPWENYPFQEILRTVLVSKDVEDAFIQGGSGAPDFAKSHHGSGRDQVLGMLEAYWHGVLENTGRTIQLDLREHDLAKVIPHYSFHISKMSFRHKNHQGAHETLIYKMFRSTLWKGYNKHYRSFAVLRAAIEQQSFNQYGANFFEPRHLHLCPPLTMVFFRDELAKLASETPPRNAKWDQDSYEHIHNTAMESISSFVGIDVGPAMRPYNFILEVGYSGLGLGYDHRTPEKAWNPLTGDELTDADVIFASRVDRALIDVNTELRDKHKDVLLSSCTRLPDVITPQGNFKADFKTAKLGRWRAGEKGIDAELRAVHGGLYPQSDLVVADNPAAEIAARVWIDKKMAGLGRRALLKGTPQSGKWRPYYDWLAQGDPGDGHSIDEVASMLRSLNTTFPANTVTPRRQLPMMEAETAGAANPNVEAESLSEPSPLAIRVSGVAGPRLEQPSEADRAFARRRQRGPAFVRISGMTAKFGTVAEARLEDARRGAYRAAREDDVGALGDLLTKYAYPQLNRRWPLDGTLLNSACFNGSLAAVACLFDHGVSLHHDLLMTSCAGSHAGLVDCLAITEGPKPTVYCTRFGPSTSLGCASFRGHDRLVELLLKKLRQEVAAGLIDPGASAEPISQALQTALAQGRTAIANRLLDEGAEPSRCALTAACGCDQPDEGIVRRLLEREGGAATINHQEKVEFSAFSASRNALEAACTAGHLSISKLLLARGADANSPGALAAACLRRHLPIVHLLVVDHKAEVVRRDDNILRSASRSGDAPIVKLLLDHGAHTAVNAGLNSNRNPGHPKSAPTPPGKWGRPAEWSSTAIAAAYERHHAVIVSLLLDHGASVDFDLPEEAQRFDSDLTHRLAQAGQPPHCPPQQRQQHLPRGRGATRTTVRRPKPFAPYTKPTTSQVLQNREAITTNTTRDERTPRRRGCACLICQLDDRARPALLDSSVTQADPVSFTLRLMGLDDGDDPDQTAKDKEVEEQRLHRELIYDVLQDEAERTRKREEEKGEEHERQRSPMAQPTKGQQKEAHH